MTKAAALLAEMADQQARPPPANVEKFQRLLSNVGVAPRLNARPQLALSRQPAPPNFFNAVFLRAKANAVPRQTRTKEFRKKAADLQAALQRKKEDKATEKKIKGITSKFPLSMLARFQKQVTEHNLKSKPGASLQLAKEYEKRVKLYQRWKAIEGTLPKWGAMVLMAEAKDMGYTKESRLPDIVNLFIAHKPLVRKVNANVVAFLKKAKASRAQVKAVEESLAGQTLSDLRAYAEESSGVTEWLGKSAGIANKIMMTGKYTIPLVPRQAVMARQVAISQFQHVKTKVRNATLVSWLNGWERYLSADAREDRKQKLLEAYGITEANDCIRKDLSMLYDMFNIDILIIAIQELLDDQSDQSLDSVVDKVVEEAKRRIQACQAWELDAFEKIVHENTEEA